MRETTLAFVTFSITILFLIQIKNIRQLRKLKKENERVTFYVKFMENIGNIIDYFLYIIGSIILFIIFIFFINWLIKEVIVKWKDRKKKRHDEIFDEKEPRGKRKYDTYLTKRKQVRSRVKELVIGKEKANIWWVSFKANVSKEKIIEIFEDEPDYIIDNGIIYKKELMSKEELNNIIKKRAREEKIAQRICPVCETPFEIGELTETSCEKCGERLKVEVKPLIEIPDKSDQLAEIEEQSITEKRAILQYNPTWLMIFSIVNIILFFMPWRLAYYQIVIAIMIVGFGIRDIVIDNKRAIVITSIILAVMTIIFCILDFTHVFSIYESLN